MNVSHRVNSSKAEAGPRFGKNRKQFHQQGERMDPVKILRRAWDILWSYRALWVFGLILAVAGAGASSSASKNGSRYQYNENNPPSSPPNMERAFQDFKHELNKLFDQGVPKM